MKEIAESLIEQILQGNSENLNLEFKATFDFNENIWARERLVRSMLAMSNTRNFAGLEDNHLALFKSKIEDLKSKVESFSSSPVSYEIGIGEYKRKKLIVISVAEFFLSPLICRKNGEHKDKHLEEGSIYIRTLKDKPSSIKLTNPVDIQDFLERITDKQISNLHKRGWKHDTENLKGSRSSFEKERADF